MMRTRLDRLFREEHGVVAPLVALMLVAFIGMAALTIDVGRLYAQRADLQHSMDAAALAGATAFIRESLAGEALPENKAKTAAETVAGANGDSGANAEVLPGSTAYDARIRVSSSRPTDLYFARVLKLFSVDVGAQSIARAWRAKGIRSSSNLIPLSINLENFVGPLEDKIGEQVVLKLRNDDKNKGNAGAVAFGDDSGASDYEERLKNGYPEPIHIGDIIHTEPGHMAGPTKDSLDPDEKDAEKTGWYGRVGDTVIVPIVDLTGIEGTKPTAVLGFARVRITKVANTGHGNNEEAHVTGELVGLTSEGTDESVETGGIWSYKLVKN